MDAAKCLPLGQAVLDWPRYSFQEQRAPMKYRLRQLDNGRWSVERFDLHEEDWLIVYIDDSALSAFVQMGLIVGRCSGEVVCHACGLKIENPLLGDAGVICQECPAAVDASGSARMLGVVLLGLLAAGAVVVLACFVHLAAEVLR
jgi:hypothetical protein